MSFLKSDIFLRVLTFRPVGLQNEQNFCLFGKCYSSNEIV